jgi:NAD(P)-dependent dehydrogenase (short-subunit alcohol dehydrogenase family)
MENNIAKVFGLDGKVAVVTGAAGQLGSQYVRAMLSAGAKVVGIDIDLEDPKGRLAGITGDDFLPLEADITDRASLERALELIVRKFGGVHALVNNAAIDAPPNMKSDALTGPFETYPRDALQKMFDVNLMGSILCCQVFGGHMASHNGGSIINISSIYGILAPDQRLYTYKEKPFFKPVGYSVTKSGVLNLTRYLAAYWAEKKVRVNTLTLAGVFNDQDQEFLKRYTAKVPLGRMARADEYNGAVVFLVSDASSYMTGSNMIVDGGYSAW